MKKLLNKEMGFMAGVLVYLTILVVNSRKLSAASKAMPMAVIVFCAILIVVKGGLLVVKPGSGAQKSDESAPEGENTPKDAWARFMAIWKDEGAVRSMIFIGWLVGFAAAVNLIGFIPTTVIGLAILLLTVSKVPPVRAALIVLGTYLFVYLLFVRMLHVRFPAGIFWS